MSKCQLSKDEIFELKLVFQLLEDNGVLCNKKTSNFILNMKNKERDDKSTNYINRALIHIFNEVEEEIKNRKIGFEEFAIICSKYLGKNTNEEDFKHLFSNLVDIRNENNNDSESKISREKLIEMLKEHCGENNKFSEDDYKYFFDFYFKGKDAIEYEELKTLYYK